MLSIFMLFNVCKSRNLRFLRRAVSSVIFLLIFNFYVPHVCILKGEKCVHKTQRWARSARCRLTFSRVNSLRSLFYFMSWMFVAFIFEIWRNVFCFMTWCWLDIPIWCEKFQTSVRGTQHALSLLVSQLSVSGNDFNYQSIARDHRACHKKFEDCAWDHKEITFMLEFHASSASYSARSDIFAHLFYHPLLPASPDMKIYHHMLRISRLLFAFSCLVVTAWARRSSKTPTPHAHDSLLTECSEADSLCFNSFFMINSISVRYDEKMDSSTLIFRHFFRAER